MRRPIKVAVPPSLPVINSRSPRAAAPILFPYGIFGATVNFLRFSFGYDFHDIPLFLRRNTANSRDGLAVSERVRAGIIVVERTRETEMLAHCISLTQLHA